MRKKGWKIIISWIATALIFIGFYYITDLEVFLAVLNKADKALLTAALGLSMFAHVFLLNRYYMDMLKSLGCEITFKECLKLRMGTMPLKNIIPFELGDLSRPVYLLKVHHLDMDKGVISVLTGYLLAVIFYGLFTAIGLFFIDLQSLTLSLLGAAVVVPAIILFVKKKEVLRSLMSMSERVFYENNKREGNDPVIENGVLNRAICYNFGFELVKIASCVIVFSACAVKVPLPELLVYLAVSIFIGMIPVTVMGLGTREAAVMAFFAGFAPRETLLVCGMLMSFAIKILPALCGLFFTRPLLNDFLSAESK